MFKMNPSAKEFVPAHILKKRQEEADRLGELTQKLDKVDINKSNIESSENRDANKKTTTTLNKSARGVQEQASQQLNSSESNDNVATKNKLHNSSSATLHETTNHQSPQEVQNENNHVNNNNHIEDGEYPEGLQELIDEEDERFLLKAGENICEFNGEQFIIPGDDDEFEPPNRAGYDFGNAEDNEDEDVCNAFEEFLENLPNQ